ncbi:MAG: ATP-binding protein [Peptostreptococcaceae bacterium]|nr:ATP-binding protein [Peptostreptococcaceae bacterium]
MTILNYDDEIKKILATLPSENATLDYKEIPYKTESYHKFIRDVIAMLNSEEGYKRTKYIIFGVANNSSQGIGLKIPMPDDNEFQNLVNLIRPRPEVLTGRILFDDLVYGYVRISESNDERVYEAEVSYPQNRPMIHEGQAFIRRGSVTYIMSNADRRRVEKTLSEKNQYLPVIPDRNIIAVGNPLKARLTALTSATLLGGWNQSLEGDQTIIQEFVEQDFVTWLTEMQQLKAEENTDIKLVQGLWKIKNRKNYLLNMKNSIFDNHIDALIKIAIKILSEYNPKYDLPIDKRGIANIQGVKPVYSDSLKDGIAEVLAILSNSADEFSNCSSGIIENMVDDAIYKILNNKDWKTWESIGWNLSFLAEASPKIFLRVLEEECAKDTNAIQQLLLEKDGWITPTNCGAGLIYALQKLAWSKEHFGGACMLLAHMSEYRDDIKVSIANILLPWHPQTTAPVEKRIAIIKRISKSLKLESWPIIKGLLPNQNRTGMEIDKPQYLPGNYEVTGIKTIEYWYVSEEYLKIALDVISGHIEQMIEIVDLLDDVNPTMLEGITKMLITHESDITDDFSRYGLWDKLLSFTNRQKNFSDATWTLRKDIVMEIDKIAELYVPKDHRFFISRLFKQDQYDLLFGEDDHDVANAELLKLKDLAISELYLLENIQGILNLIEVVDKPDLVGMSLARLKINKEVEKYIIALFGEAESKETSLSKGYILQKFILEGYDWIKKIEISEWDESKRVALLILLPFKKETWELVSLWLDINQTKYWKLTTVWNTEKACPDYVLKWLLKVGRPEAAIILMANAIIGKEDCNMEIAFEALEQNMESQDKQDSMSSYYISKIIQWLQVKCVDKERLYLIEWQYYNILDGECTPKTLFAKIANDPKFFMQLVCLIYKKRNSNEDDQIVINEKTQKLATHAWNILNDWNCMPGIKEDNTIDEKEMNNWIKGVQDISRKEDRYEVAMQQLGHVAFYSPKSPSGFFIDESVAEMLEERDSKHQRSGYEIEAYNSRGVHCINPNGSEELALATLWDQKADEAEKRSYFIFAKTLRNIADSYRRESKANIWGHKLEELED